MINDVETSIDTPFYQHQTFCVIYNKQFCSYIISNMYDLLRSNSEQDGVAMYIRGNIQFSLREDLSICIEG